MPVIEEPDVLQFGMGVQVGLGVVAHPLDPTAQIIQVFAAVVSTLKVPGQDDCEPKKDWLAPNPVEVFSRFDSIVVVDVARVGVPLDGT